jgi:choline dehydrogenase-like flavoprotein
MWYVKRVKQLWDACDRPIGASFHWLQLVSGASLTLSQLGGGSSINFMMYTRASASDYDDFKSKGWSTKELIPLMKKHETCMRVAAMSLS